MRCRAQCLGDGKRGKIEANAGKPGAMIRMGKIERGLYAEIDAISMAAALARARADLGAALAETCRLAGIAPAAVETAILVGGSSLMGLVVTASAVGSAVTGSLAVVRRHDHAWSVYAATGTGALLTALMLREVAQGLGWLPS